MMKRPVVCCGAVVLLVVCFLGASLATSEPNAASAWYTVYYNPTNSQYSVTPGRDNIAGVATAEWADERFTTGWARFNLVGNSVYGDDVQAMGAGYLEGYLSADLIWASWLRISSNFLFNCLRFAF